MKKFLLFGNAEDEKLGGWGDFAGDFESLDEAQSRGVKCLQDGEWDWWQVVDTRLQLVVKSSYVD